MATKKKTAKKKTAKKKTYTVRIEWPVYYYCDTTVQATNREEAARIALEDPDYDNQSSYDEPGDSTVEGVCEGEDYRFEDRDEVGGSDPSDARVTAAAPELLAICEAACLRSIERQEAGGRGGVLDDDIFQQMAELVRRCRDE